MSYSDPKSTQDCIAAIIAACAWELSVTSSELRQSAASEPDFIVQDHGSIWTFRARSPAARAWWVDNVGDGPCLGRNWSIEHRCVREILDGLQRDGFTPVGGRVR